MCKCENLDYTELYFLIANIVVENVDEVNIVQATQISKETLDLIRERLEHEQPQEYT